MYQRPPHFSSIAFFKMAFQPSRCVSSMMASILSDLVIRTDPALDQILFIASRASTVSTGCDGSTPKITQHFLFLIDFQLRLSLRLTIRWTGVELKVSITRETADSDSAQCTQTLSSIVEADNCWRGVPINVRLIWAFLSISYQLYTSRCD